ncbi:Tex family protein [Bacillus sp. 2205SS5-2]|uniref:Tex family protein n=1 Tax=Bacillus sp. 2205SS5-2 TaxID=3109031 RepID=UPI0030056BE9
MSVELKEKNVELIQKIKNELGLQKKQVSNVISLLSEGNTVPFIARYRKEMTDALDEVQIRSIMDRHTYLLNLEQRKTEVLRLIEEQGKLTEKLAQSIQFADKLQLIEDIYRPYKQKRRTKATVAKEKGLEPFADWLLNFPTVSIEKEAQVYLSEEKEISHVQDVINGSKDIIAEKVSDTASYREWIRKETFRRGIVLASSKNEEKDEKKVFEMYYQYEEPILKIVPHRILAMNRGEKEEILKVVVQPPVDVILSYLKRQVIKTENSTSVTIISEAIEDSYKRLIQPSIEREIRNELTEKAEDQAIHIFSENLKNLLLQPPLKGKIVLGVDPAYRTGCKLAVVDDTGKVLAIDVIYPHPPKPKREDAERKVADMLKAFNVEIVAIGNGTASRETEQFIVDLLKAVSSNVSYLIVNEAGASVYSASELAREEFPHLQVEERSAVSIARRLQDPLAELVKIDPKSVGVGQYQHDVSQKKLNESLNFVVETAVNRVGVNVNTASSSLLQYVAGLSKTVANNIVKKREEEGRFASRKELKTIPRLGAKTYEQCIGFLRILEGEEPLDNTSIHPENYKKVKDLLQDLKLSSSMLGSQKLREALGTVNLMEKGEKLDIGELTLLDIRESLVQPGRDPRDDLPQPLLKKDVLKMEDLLTGMELQGTVRNVVDFGAFVDIGVKQDGLVHISKLKRGFVKHPLDVVSLGDVVTVWVESIDVQKGRVSLTMLSPIEK